MIYHRINMLKIASFKQNGQLSNLILFEHLVERVTKIQSKQNVLVCPSKQTSRDQISNFRSK